MLIKKIVHMYFQYLLTAIVTIYEEPSIKFSHFSTEQIIFY